MKLSTRSTYGMRALVELALVGGHGPLSASVIAQRQALSVAYLEQILHRLKRHGLIRSVRGPRGGYVLAHASERITMAEVVHILDGNNGRGNGRSGSTGKNGAASVRTDNGADTRAGRRTKSAAPDHAKWIAEAVWRCVHERLTQSLGAVTLQDLCDEVHAIAGKPLDHQDVFHI